MRRFPTLLALLVLLAAAPPARAQAERVAVVDLWRLMTRHRGMTQAEQALKEAQDSSRTKREETERTLKRIRDEYLALPLESAERSEKLKRFMIQEAHSKAELEFDMRSALERYTRTLEGIYTEVQGLVAKVAREKGLLLVLQKTDDPLRLIDQDQFALKTALRAVVYYDTSLDITAEVERRLPR
jgi:Skp family chaperone for outer membrane proteins